jgi:uncharacterized cupin superfamily protein
MREHEPAIEASRFYAPRMASEAPMKRTDAGLVPDGEGWFVINAREGRWIRRDGRGANIPLTGWTEFEAEAWFPQLGMALVRLEPGEPIGMYHWEADQEGFLVLSGQALLLIEGEERPLRQWDFVHCPPGTRHMIVGAGEGPCLVLCAGSREHIRENCNGGAYTVDETALAHGAGVEEEVSDANLAYARFAPSEPTPYRDGWLP